MFDDRRQLEGINVADRDRRPRRASRPDASRGPLRVGIAVLATGLLIVAVVALRAVGPFASAGATSSPTAAMPSAAVAVATPSTPGSSEVPSIQSPPPTQAPSAPPFTTSGVTSSWQGFTWSQLAAGNPLVAADPGIQMLQWSRGFVVYGTTGGGAKAFVWTSSDGQTWTQVTSITVQHVLLAASPAGLVAIGGDPTQDAGSQKVWTSSDGIKWSDAGSPTGLGFLDSIAGTSSGLVAVEHTVTGSGKLATSQYGVAHSNDGIAWTSVAGAPALSDEVIVPRVQSGSGRYFLLGAPTALSGKGGGGDLWWSDDGQKWTTVELPLYPASLDFGRDGIVLHTSAMSAPGAAGIELSTDGGKTWQADSKFGPLGATTCGIGECSAGPDGVIESNGTIFLAVKSDGHAWTSYDGRTWMSISWTGPASGTEPNLVMPRGVVVGKSYGAAQ